MIRLDELPAELLPFFALFCILDSGSVQNISTRSWRAVPAVDSNIDPRGIRRRIRRQVEVHPLEFTRLALTAIPPQPNRLATLRQTKKKRKEKNKDKKGEKEKNSPHRNLIPPRRPRLRGAKLRDARVDIPRTHRVGPRKPNPLDRQALAQMHHRGLARVVRGLQLRHIHDVPAHAGRRDEAAARERRVAQHRARLLLLAPEVRARGPRAKVGAVEVGAHHRVVHGHGPVEHRARGPDHARVGDEDVQAVVEGWEEGGDGGGDGVVGGDVYLVGLAWFWGEMVGE